MKKFQVAGIDMPCIDLALSVDQFPKPNAGRRQGCHRHGGGGPSGGKMCHYGRRGRG